MVQELEGTGVEIVKTEIHGIPPSVDGQTTVEAVVLVAQTNASYGNDAVVSYIEEQITAGKVVIIRRSLDSDVNCQEEFLLPEGILTDIAVDGILRQYPIAWRQWRLQGHVIEYEAITAQESAGQRP